MRIETRILLLSAAHMRAAAILGPGCSANHLKPFQTDLTIDWRMGMPAAADQADVILLFGGDGTMHRHLSPLVTLGLPVLVVPAGSGNDFARGLGLGRVRDSLAAWRRFCAGQHNQRTIDLGVITALEAAADLPANQSSSNPALRTRNYFSSVAAIGLDGEVTRRANELPRWLRGHGGYALTLASTIFRFAPFPLKILTLAEAGGWAARRDRPAILAAIANSSTYGGGMKIAPRAQIADGQLDVCVVGAVDPFKMACLFPAVYFGRHLGIREVDYFQTARVRLETETPFDVYADGEYVCRTPVEIAVQPAALKALTA